MNLALFDFDGTLTTEDTFTKFLFFATPKLRLVIGFCLTFPAIALYKLKIINASALRPVLSKVAFWRRSEVEVLISAEKFVSIYLPQVFRTEALEKLEWHKSLGHQVIVVSASLDPYLKIWCQQQGIRLICSELETFKGKYTGNYVRGDCSKERKLTYLKETTDLSKYSKIFAYGDSTEDYPMLSIADIKFYQGKRI